MTNETKSGLKMILAGLATLGLIILMILKGFDVAPIFNSVWAEIAFISILFLGAGLFILSGIITILDEFVSGKNKPQKF